MEPPSLKHLAQRLPESIISITEDEANTDGREVLPVTMRSMGILDFGSGSYVGRFLIIFGWAPGFVRYIKKGASPPITSASQADSVVTWITRVL